MIKPVHVTELRTALIKAVHLQELRAAHATIAAATLTAKAYYHLDAIGSVRALTSSTGAELERHDYTAFGEELTSPTGLDTRRFGGKERDPETGLAYFAARYYAPETGRFAQADDPGFGNVFDPQSLNQYGYTSGNPLRWVDPSGHQQLVFKSETIEFLDWFSGWFGNQSSDLPGRPRMPGQAVTQAIDCTGQSTLSVLRPSTASLREDVVEAMKHWPDAFWFKRQVKGKGPWDFKQLDDRYQDFGNFHYGVVGAAFGFPKMVLHRMAGWAQSRTPENTRPEWGKWYGGFPFNDDPRDQAFVSIGIAYYQNGCLK